MCSKFMPQTPASIVGTAAMATQPEMRPHVLVLLHRDVGEVHVQHLGQQLPLDLDAGHRPVQVVVDVPEVVAQVGPAEGVLRSPAAAPAAR